MIKGGDKKYLAELAFYERIQAQLEKGLSARLIEVTEEERPFLKDLFLLTLKPVLYVANLSESDLGTEESDLVKQVRDYCQAGKG